MAKHIGPNLSPEANQVLTMAGDEARRLNHEYIGTEHVLLGLFRESSGMASSALASLGVEEARVRQEIDRLVQRGPHPVTLKKLPQTPRTKQAIGFACEDAQLLDRHHVQPEHLLLGLLREPEGVAGVVLRNLGLNLDRVWAEVLKIRMLQMTAVERIVRPVRASIVRKRKMREELLTHLTAIYEKELARRSEPAAAVREAVRRFGAPAELTAELQSTVPVRERIGYRMDRWFGWRAPETAARWMLRAAGQSFLAMAVTVLVSTVVSSIAIGWSWRLFIALRTISAVAIVLPVDVFLLGLLYFKIRDAMFGVFGSRKSMSTVLLYAVLFALVIAMSGVGMMTISDGRPNGVTHTLLPFGVVGIATAIGAILLARRSGPTEIRDTFWACLDLSGPDGESPLVAS